MTAHSISVRQVRSYLAGGGATAALIGAALVAFLTVAALFAFNGLPGDSAADDSDTVFVGAQGAPGAAATAAAGAAGAVAAAPAPIPPAAAAAILAAAGPDGVPPAGAPDTGFTPPADGGAPTVPTAAESPTGAPTTTQPGPVGSIVDEITNLGLGDATGPVTGPVDQTLQQTAPDLSDAVGQAGQNTTDTINGVLGGGN